MMERRIAAKATALAAEAVQAAERERAQPEYIAEKTRTQSSDRGRTTKNQDSTDTDKKTGAQRNDGREQQQDTGGDGANGGLVDAVVAGAGAVAGGMQPNPDAVDALETVSRSARINPELLEQGLGYHEVPVGAADPAAAGRFASAAATAAKYVGPAYLLYSLKTLYDENDEAQAKLDQQIMELANSASKTMAEARETPPWASEALVNEIGKDLADMIEDHEKLVREQAKTSDFHAKQAVEASSKQIASTVLASLAPLAAFSGPPGWVLSGLGTLAAGAAASASSGTLYDWWSARPGLTDDQILAQKKFIQDLANSVQATELPSDVKTQVSERLEAELGLLQPPEPPAPPPRFTGFDA